MSSTPPGEKGTKSFTGLLGYLSCAKTKPNNKDCVLRDNDLLTIRLLDASYVCHAGS